MNCLQIDSECQADGALVSHQIWFCEDENLGAADDFYWKKGGICAKVSFYDHLIRDLGKPASPPSDGQQSFSRPDSDE
jgi:hypothetical protein